MESDPGIVPENSLRVIKNFWSLGSVRPIVGGIVPLNLLLATKKVLMKDILKREGGIVPDKLLAPTPKYDSLFNLPNSSGIVPTR